MHWRTAAGLAELLRLDDEPRVDAGWTRALAAVREYADRPSKRVRPALLAIGYGVARPGVRLPPGVWRFAAAVELLHTFLLVHDDVADGTALRRGGPALHRVLAPGRRGEDLAVVVGDHLFARAVEGMLTARLPRATPAARYWLSVCRATAAGQYMDLALTGVPLRDVSLWQTLRIALCKTARYSFVAPLVSGALLGGAGEPVRRALERMGRQLGIAFQLRDDLLGLFGQPERTGKPADDDLVAGKPTFPVVAAYQRASRAQRDELETLWTAAREGEAARARLRDLIDAYGGRAATERAVQRATLAARRTLETLRGARRCRALLDELIDELAVRTA